MEGRKVQRFFFALGHECEPSDRETFTDLFKGLRRAFGSGDEGWEQWKSNALEKWKGDEMLQALLRKEQVGE